MALVAALAVASPLMFAARESVDLVQTGSVTRAPLAVQPPSNVPAAVAAAVAMPTVIEPMAAKPAVLDDRGSPEFRAALSLLDSGDATGAYALAGKLANGVERRTVEWAAIYFSAGEIDYRTIQEFIEAAPEFVGAPLFQTRLEQSLTKAEPAAGDILSVLGQGTPNSIDAQIMLAKAYASTGDTAAATTLARQIWTENFLTDMQEAEVLASLGDLLDRDSHWQRAMHLMMHDRAKGSERLLPLLSAAQQTLVVARAAVSRNDADAKAKLDAVDASLQDNPVYIFSRAQRARQFELWPSAVEWLNKAPAELPDAAEWWYERRALMRQLLDSDQPKLAFAVADGYRNGPEGRMVEAHFNAGYIALSFLDDAAAAKAHFSAMVPHATLPDSVTQANYWLGRANTALGDTAAAKLAYETAAKFSTVYYGQLARAELGEPDTAIRPLPDISSGTVLFDSNPVVQAIRLLAKNDKGRMAVTLLRQYGMAREAPGELLLVAQLAQEIGADHVGISIAGVADQRGGSLDTFGFPTNGVPEGARLAADRSAVYAIMRQESMFQIDAVSPAGARGLMQLMPGTARDVARDLGVDYSATKLVSDASYNALLGSTYLGKQLDRYNGSLVLAAAAYNAGPGNANKWIKAYGDPRTAGVDPVVWVERIPFQETRTYVKRVLGNYLVYRERFGYRPISLKQALRTIEDKRPAASE